MKKMFLFLFVSMSILLYASTLWSSQDQYRPRWVNVTATAYCPCAICCGADANGITSTGRNANTRGVAVAPRLIPYGSRLDIPGYGHWIPADDTGGAMRQAARRGEYLIDLRFKTHEEALQWGRKQITVRIWERK